MRSTILFLLWLWLITPQSFTCSTAATHAHDSVREGQIVVSSWAGCSLAGTINGSAVKLWADSSSCSLRAKVPGTFQVRYDATCGQVLDLSNGPLPPYCPPLPSPTPTPTPTPITPTPQPAASSTIEIVSPANVREGPSLSATAIFIASAGDRGATTGPCQQDPIGDNVYCPVTFITAKSGFVAVQFLRVLATPTPTPVPVPSPTPQPTPTPTPQPTPVPTPVPTPTPTPSPTCSLTVPATVTIPKNGTGSISVTLSGLSGSADVTAVSSSPGQVSVSPQSRAVTAISTIVAFTLRAKKQGAFITFTSLCGTATTTVGVR